MLWINLPNQPKLASVQQRGNLIQTSPTASPSATPIPFKHAGERSQIKLPIYQAQTFNNCGPASLAMMMHWAGTPVTQEELGQQMRPYQTPYGDNDDKSVSSEEIVYWAEQYGLYAIHRPGGDLDLIRTFLANGIPVMVTSWLHPQEDIGHFRILTGFDDTSKTLYQDDSYDGPNLSIDYSTLLEMWKPFQYEYHIVVDPSKKALVEAILGNRTDLSYTWQQTLNQAHQQLSVDNTDTYARFNLAVAYYHLGNYQETVKEYEQIAAQLPRRMLWYQIEPIQAYLEIGRYQTVRSMTAQILNNENRAYSELYLLRGASYEAEGDNQQARYEFEQAVKYNTNLPYDTMHR
ncbi:MAG: C39 family peptidase [Patescibacteria group bacterium]